MLILDCNQVEVINIDNGVVKIVHINYYERNMDKFIPTDEYYIKDNDGNVIINKKRIEKAKTFIVKEEEVLEDSIDNKIEEVKKVKRAKPKTKKGKK